MNREYLMIGDWVYNTHNKQNEQVVEVGSNCVMLAYNDLYAFDEIEPISLTPKILEKNGFVDEMSNYAYRTDNYNVCYYCADERLSINKYGAILDVHCFYVHQLQHALRLCGIKIEIEL